MKVLDRLATFVKGSEKFQNSADLLVDWSFIEPLSYIWSFSRFLEEVSTKISIFNKVVIAKSCPVLTDLNCIVYIPKNMIIHIGLTLRTQ